MTKASFMAAAALGLALSGPAARAAPRQLPPPPPQSGNSAQPSRTKANISADPAAISAILRSYGFQPQQRHWANGDPYIDISSSGTPFLIFFDNCVDGEHCRTLQFYAGFAMDTPPSMKRINQWNRDNRFAKAYIDTENDPRLEMDMNLNEGGIARSNFVSNFLIWLRLLDAFKQHIGWEKQQ